MLHTQRCQHDSLQPHSRPRSHCSAEPEPWLLLYRTHRQSRLAAGAQGQGTHTPLPARLMPRATGWEVGVSAGICTACSREGMTAGASCTTLPLESLKLTVLATAAATGRLAATLLTAALSAWLMVTTGMGAEGGGGGLRYTTGSGLRGQGLMFRG